MSCNSSLYKWKCIYLLPQRKDSKSYWSVLPPLRDIYSFLGVDTILSRHPVAWGINKYWGNEGEIVNTHSYTLLHIHQRKEKIYIGGYIFLQKYYSISAISRKQWQEGIAVPNRNASGARQMRWGQMGMVLYREAWSRERRKRELRRLYRSSYETS